MKQIIFLKEDFKPEHSGNDGYNLYDVKRSTFPGGEVFLRFENAIISEEIEIITRLNSSDDVIELIMATDALRRLGAKKVSVYFPYLPYARQDRACTHGESFSLKVFGNLINSQNYEEVTVLDAHSDVAGACIDRLKVESNKGYVGRMVRYHYGYEDKSGSPDMSNAILVSPDAGALKKIYDIAKFCRFDTVAVGEKLRNLATGEIIRTEINRPDFQGKDCWIVDDICDGGRTFIELAKVLKERNAGKVILFVTHGIFSKGLDLPNIDVIYTTDSVKNLENIDGKFYQTKL